MFCRIDKAANLKQDYDTNELCAGSWDGVLHHQTPSLKQYEMARRAVLDWAVPTTEGYERKIHIPTEAGLLKVDCRAAHDKLSGPDPETFVVYHDLAHPLTLPYASPHTDAKFWVHEDMSQIIMSQFCAWTGDIEVDIQNFHRFRVLLKKLAKALDASSVAWGEEADRWPVERTLHPSLLTDEDSMWGAFTENLGPALVDESILDVWQMEFGKGFGD